MLFIRQKVVSHIQCCLSLKKMLCDVRELERDPRDKIEITESGLQQKVWKKPMHLGKTDMLHFNSTVLLQGKNSIAILLGVQALKEGLFVSLPQTQMPSKAWCWRQLSRAFADNQAELCGVSQGQGRWPNGPFVNTRKDFQKGGLFYRQLLSLISQEFFCMQCDVLFFFTLKNYF